MKKFFMFVVAIVCALSMQAKTIYFVPNDWRNDGAVFFIHSWGTGDNDALMSQVSTNLYSAAIPDGDNNAIFVRMPSGSTAMDWSQAWNQTENLTIPAGKDCFTFTSWDGGAEGKSTGTWSKYVDPSSITPYLAGEGFPGASWDAGSHMEMPNGTITLSDLGAGTYKFKVTNNTWDFFLGFADVNASCSTPGYGSDTDGNIVVKLASSGEITISIADGAICVTIVGETEQIYSSSVPSQCGDVMMQGFFWNSYMENDSATMTDVFGDTRWKSMLPRAEEIGAYFDLIWLPPSAYASGTGYHPRQYSNQNSDWGSRADLEKLIASFHNSGTKVVADVVVNHLEAMASWCDFAVQDFGEYGRFEIDGSYICQDDEMNASWTKADTLAGECWGTAIGSYDDGYGDEQNYASARDLAHNDEKVREFCRAYAKWLINEMHYDGFRYDYCKGFHASHINDYNQAGNAYISFMEMWSGNEDIIRNIRDANYNTMSLDFQTKYSAFDGIAAFDYSKCKGSGLLGAGMSKYAVTFIDSHDWFLRDNGQEFGGNGNSMKPVLKDRLLQANAFMLSMPGVPCVFYPHWAQYKEELKPMINARHLAGVHSESAVSDEEAEHDGYKATIHGKNGNLIVCLGNKAGNTYSGYRKVAYGNGYAIWTNANADVAPGIICTQSRTFEDSIAGVDVTIQAVGGSGNAVIYYTTDGTNPTTNSSVYSAALNFKQTTTLKVMAVCGTAQSKVQTYTYTYREPLQRGIRVRFNKPAAWEKVYYFAWRVVGEDEKGTKITENIIGAFPGQRVYQDAEGWYSYEFDASLDSVNFQISSGTDCGSIHVKSNDLMADYDVCYGWRDGKDTVNMEEIELDCETVLHPEFGLSISPESSFFRDMNEGIEVNITAVGAENAMIYYTTDGTEPTTSSLSAQGSVSFKVNQTTTVKAYAMNGQVKSPTYSETYTYKAPQSGPLTVKFIKPEEWETLYLYAFTRVKKGAKFVDTPYSLDGKSAKWPGMKWETKEGDWYVHTMKPEIKEIYVIFTEGNKKPQTQDIYLVENTCYLWRASCGQAVVDDECDGLDPEGIEEVEHETPTFDINQPMYNIMGQRVNGSYQGIVIQNGHKYLIIR